MTVREYMGIVTEILRREILIEADNEMNARTLLESMYRNENIVLGAEDLADTNVEIAGLKGYPEQQATFSGTFHE